MKDILITSSVLIGALLVLRQIFRKTISRRVQYALWALVLVRLLVPVSLPALEHNVLTATESIETGVSEQLENVSVYLNPVAQAEVTRSTIASPDITTPAVVVRDRTSVAVHEYDYKVRGYSADATITSEDGTHVTWYAKALTITEMLSYVWYAGIIVMICWLLISNFRFWRNLCKARIPYMIDGCKHTVYLVESGLSSPCLFGLFRPAIYLNSAAAETKETLRHVIAHETTHARHLDPLWSLLRSVCLVIYWFDPLVWAAAFVSRTDCELACDEGAMKRLGDEERLSYGQTLLSLIPVRHGGTNPLLSATTMTSDKKRLKDRITRIAENRQTVAAALFLVLAAVVLVCAVTFTGAKESQEEELIDDPITTLSGDELAWFNEEFFKAAIYEGDTSYINIRNQFLSSHYERPEDIDLYELFYCGTGTDELVSDAELEIVGAFYTDGTQVCPTTKMSVSAMDAVLLTYTGLTVAETNKIDLECFPYLEEYDAYYHTYSDTNYRSGVTITSGEREGDLIHLYYNDSFLGDGWKCVTLQDKGNNNYWFVSNLPSEQPVISVALPSDEPCLTIPLSDLEPSVPQEVEVTPASGDCAEWGYGIRLDNNIHIRPYLSTDGNIYAAIIYESAVENGQMTEWEAGRFFTYPTYPNWDEPELKNCQLEPFSDLFGCSGVIVSYNDYITGGPDQGGIYGPCYNYYAFSEDGTPLLLARTTEHSQIVDMDGDGTFELLGNRQLFFKRDAVVYEADIVSLLQEAWPELLFWDFSFININRRCLIVSGMASMPEWGENASTSFLRDIYFDGANLQVYADLPGTTDHVSNNVPGNYPEDVYAAAKAQILDAYIATKNGADGALSDQSFDDWRVSGLSTVETAYPYPDVELDIYTLSYQFHSADPGNVMLAGGTYVQEDGWVGGFYSEESPYLLFHVLEDGSRVLLESYIAGDCSTDSIMFHGYLSRTLVKNGLIIPSDISGKNHLYMFYDNQFVYLNELAEFNSSEQLSALQSLAQYCTNLSDENHIQMFQQGLDNLKWDAMKETSALTESGKNTYQLLLDILDGNGHVVYMGVGGVPLI